MCNSSRHVSATLVWAFAALAICLSGAAADPFPWAQAEAETGGLRLADGTDVDYRSASILLGDRFEIAVALRWRAVDAPVEQEIVHEIADSPPLLSVRGNVIQVGWTAFPVGAEAETAVASCWRLTVNRRTFVKSPCDCAQ